MSFMRDKKNSNSHLMLRPTEQNTTAAWANIEKVEEITNVSVPSEIDVYNAKEWVDSNEK